jgi:hypothetical protein
LQYIQVGRAREIESLLKDVEQIKNGGSAFRLIVGDFGSGKSFLLHLIRTVALREGLVTLHADLAPDRRLQANGGQARNLYAELTRNCATRTKPEGGALASVVERFITEARREAESESTPVEEIIAGRLHDLSEMVGGFDFAKVIKAYWRGYETDSEQLRSDAVRWLRGEFTRRNEAKDALGVGEIVNDKNVYDHLKLLSLFARQAGYAGLLVNLDEMVNLYKLASTRSRSINYEQILRILNDCLQGQASHIGFMLGGTPDFLSDPRKGLYSYEALKSRLEGSALAQKVGVVDYHGTTLSLQSLTGEELYVLLKNIRAVFASGEKNRELVPDEALKAFLAHCFKIIGEAYFKTPRNVIKGFVDMLSLLEQHPEYKWTDLIGQVKVTVEANSDMPGVEIQDDEDDDLSTFRM